MGTGAVTDEFDCSTQEPCVWRLRGSGPDRAGANSAVREVDNQTNAAAYPRNS